jgi:transglutaminase-like putative cysteine protease
MFLKIDHTTTYKYDVEFAGESHMEARLCPMSEPGRQRCLEFSLSVTPRVPVFEYGLAGQLGAVSHFVVRNVPHSALIIHAESRVETFVTNPFASLTLDAGDWDLLLSPDVMVDHAEWLSPTDLTPTDTGWDIPDLPRSSVLEYGQALMQLVYDNFEYVPGSTDVSTTLSQFVQQRRGVCQDYAHLMISSARSAGVPARYVSGYIYTSRSPLPLLGGGRGEATHGADATHAWVELYVPHASQWVGFDPTNNIVVSDRHIKVAAGRDYADVPPTKGLLRPSRGSSLPSSTELVVAVSVSEEAP